MATQELVVPKSIPITSPASVLFHLAAWDVAYSPPRADLDTEDFEAMEVSPRRRPSWRAMVVSTVSLLRSGYANVYGMSNNEEIGGDLRRSHC